MGIAAERMPWGRRYDLTPRLLVGEREHRLYPLDPQKIDYIESDGNYVSFRSGTTAYISRDTIKRLAAELAQLGFVRIGRSLLVNVRAVVTHRQSAAADLHSPLVQAHVCIRVRPTATRFSKRCP